MYKLLQNYTLEINTFYLKEMNYIFQEKCVIELFHQKRKRDFVP